MGESESYAVVAAGRTVVVDGRHYGPGEEVDLPADEVERLRAIGFIAPAVQPPAPVAEGLSVTVTDGPNVSVS
jgi:hypothetical protein